METDLFERNYLLYHSVFDFSKEVGTIGGWLTEAEGIFLYNVTNRVKPKNVVVEIGSWKGKSTVCLGRGSEDGNKVKVYAIDPHIGSSEHQKMFDYVNTGALPQRGQISL